jgi:hypothetical protein
VPRPALVLDEYVQAEVSLQEAGAQAFDRLLRPPAMWTAVNVGHIELTAAQAAKVYRVGVKPNWPDHLVIFPGKLVGIEWKTRDGALSISRVVHTRRSGRPRYVEGQRDVFPKLTLAGMRGPYVCITVEQALRMLQAEGCPMLPWSMAA